MCCNITEMCIMEGDGVELGMNSILVTEFRDLAVKLISEMYFELVPSFSSLKMFQIFIPLIFTHISEIQPPNFISARNITK